MASTVTYHEQTDMENIRKLREVLKTLPAFAKDYFRAIEPNYFHKNPHFFMLMIFVFFFSFFSHKILFYLKQILQISMFLF